MLGLVPIPVDDLRLLALAQVPATLALRALAEAMPPPFVAERSLQQLGAGSRRREQKAAGISRQR